MSQVEQRMEQTEQIKLTEQLEQTEAIAAKRSASRRLRLLAILRGSKQGPVDLPQTIASLIGMIGPIVYGLLGGNVGAGLLAAYGAMVVGSNEAEGTIRKRAGQLGRTTLIGAIAMFVGSLIGHHGWLSGIWIVAVSALAALVGGIGRTGAMVSAQFIIFLIMGTGIGGGGLHHPGGVSFMFTLGAIWGTIVSQAAAALFRQERLQLEAPSVESPPFSKRLRYWQRSLAGLAGWHYCLRVALCLTMAELVGGLLHQKKSYWIAMTVAIVLQRSFSGVLERLIQRGVGTAAGALFGGFFLLGSLPQPASVLLVAILAALRPIFRKRNYTVYAMLMTPLMVVLLGSGSAVTTEVLLERVFDTALGCLIVFLFGYVLWPVRIRQEIDGRRRTGRTAREPEA